MFRLSFEPFRENQLTGLRSRLRVQNPLAVWRNSESEITLHDRRDHFSLASS